MSRFRSEASRPSSVLRAVPPSPPKHQRSRLRQPPSLLLPSRLPPPRNLLPPPRKSQLPLRKSRPPRLKNQPRRNPRRQLLTLPQKPPPTPPPARQTLLPAVSPLMLVYSAWAPSLRLSCRRRILSCRRRCYFTPSDDAESSNVSCLGVWRARKVGVYMLCEA
jgi:hypothetical protein